MSIAQAAAVLDCAETKITRLELGQSGITKGDLLLLLSEYQDSDEHKDWMVELARTRGTRGRWGGYRAVFAEWFRMFVDLEADACEMRQVQSELVPGLLQTPEYVRALEISSPRANDEEVDAYVKSRIERQGVLTKDDPPAASFVLSESCIRRQVGDSPGIMREQLEHLAEVALRPNIHLQILPFNSRNYAAGITFDYTLLTIPSPGSTPDLEFVYVESVDDARYLDGKEEIAPYKTIFERLRMAALGPKESVDLISDALKQYNQHG